MRQHFHDKLAVLKVAVFPVGEARYPVVDRGFYIEFGVFVVVGGVEPAPDKPANIRVGEGHLKRAVPFLRGGHGAHRVVAAGGGVLSGGKHGIALIRLFNGPVSGAVVAVYALGMPGFIGELMRNPARALVPAWGEDSLQMRGFAAHHFAPGGGAVFYLKVGKEVPVVVQGERSAEVFIGCGEGDVAEFIVGILVLRGVGIELVGCHGKHVFGGVQVPDGCSIVAVNGRYRVRGSVTENGLTPAHLPHKFLRRGLND